MNQKQPRHLKDISLGNTRHEAGKQRLQPRQPDTEPGDLRQPAAAQFKCRVQLLLGIADARHVAHSVTSEQFCRFGIRLHVNENQTGSRSGDGGTLLSNVGQRLAAKRSAGVPQKHQQHWLLPREFQQAVARLRPGRVKHSRIE